MNEIKNSGFFRIISLVLIISFIAFDISWAYPSGFSEKSTLAAQGLFQQQMMTADGLARHNEIFSNMRLLTSVRSIAKALLEQKLPLKYLDTTVTDELGGVLIDGLDLSRVMVRDGVILIPFLARNNKYVIQIAPKGSLAANDLKGYVWPLLDSAADRYVIKVLPEGFKDPDDAKSFHAGEDIGASIIERISALLDIAKNDQFEGPVENPDFDYYLDDESKRYVAGYTRRQEAIFEIFNIIQHISDISILVQVSKMELPSVPTSTKPTINTDFVEIRLKSILDNVGPDSRDIIPTLVGVLLDLDKKNSLYFRKFAAKALGKIGPAATEALPALRSLLESHDGEIDKIVAEAIGMIEKAPSSEEKPSPAMETPEIIQARKKFEEAKKAALLKSGELLNFMDKMAYMNGVSDDSDFSPEGEYKPLILALGSPSTEAFVAAAQKYEEYKTAWEGKPIPIITSTGKGRGAIALIRNTLEYYKSRPDVVKVFEKLLEKPEALTEAKIIELIFRTERVTDPIFVEEESSNTLLNVEKSFDGFINAIYPFGQKVKILVVADVFHRPRANLTAMRVFRRMSESRRRPEWKIVSGPRYKYSLNDMDDAKLFGGVEKTGYLAQISGGERAGYLAQFIGDPYKLNASTGEYDDFGEIGRYLNEEVYKLFDPDNPSHAALKNRVKKEWAEQIKHLRSVLLKNCIEAKKDLDALLTQSGTKSFPAGDEVAKLRQEIAEKLDDGKMAIKTEDGSVVEDGFIGVFEAAKKNPASLSAEALAYLRESNLDEFKSIIRSARINANLAKNAKKGLALTIVAGMPFGEGNKQFVKFARLVENIRARIKTITGGKVLFNQAKGVSALHMTVKAITRTMNFAEGDAISMREALDKVKKRVGELDAGVKAGGKKSSLADGITAAVAASKPFKVKLDSLVYYYKDGEIAFALEPADLDEYGKPLKRLNIHEQLEDIKTDSKSERLHISLGRVTAPLTDRQIAEINDLFRELNIAAMKPFEIGALKVVMYGHRSLTETIAVKALRLGQPGQELNFDGSYEETEKVIDLSSGDGTKNFPEVSREAADSRIDKAKAAYRYVGISMGGNKVAVSINDGDNNIVAGPDELRWDKDPRFSKGRIKDPANAGSVMDLLAGMIVDLANKQKINRSSIRLVHVGLAGPVDEARRIAGSDFKTPNLLFDRYNFGDEMTKRLRAKGITVRVEICNDAKASLNGERFAPKGSLKNKKGGIVIIGGGINIAVDDETIKEAGHNLYQVKDRSSAIHYAWGGDKTKGRHPIEAGNIVNNCGDIGGEYKDLGKERFCKKYPGYPIIDWGGGMRDFEDRLSGPNIRARVSEAMDEAVKKRSADKKDYLAIKKIAQSGELERALTPAALKGNKVAIKWIKDVASEIGTALAAFAAYYKDKDFVNNLVLVSGICENMGKGVSENTKDKEDIFIKNIRISVYNELTKHFKMNQKQARKIAAGIVRSKMNYTRELISYQPTDSEVRRAADNITKSPITKTRGRIKEKAVLTYTINSKSFGTKSLSPDISADSPEKWQYKLKACLDQVCAGIEFPFLEGFPHALKIRVVSGLTVFSDVMIAKELNESVITIDEDLLKSPDAKWLLHIELEQKILRMGLKFLKNRLPPAAEDAALLLVYLARFNSLEERKRVQTLAFLKSNKGYDTAAFAELLKDAQDSKIEEMIEKMMEYIKKHQISADTQWINTSIASWRNAMTRLAYGNILANLLKQDVFVMPGEMKLFSPQQSKSFWSATEWMAVFETVSARMAALKGMKDAENNESVQTVSIGFQRTERGKKHIKLNIPTQLTEREYAAIARLIAVYINDHIVNEGSYWVSVTTPDLNLQAVLQETIRRDYSKMLDYVQKYYNTKDDVIRYDSIAGDEWPYQKNTVIGLDLGGSGTVKAVVIRDGLVSEPESYPLGATNRKPEDVESTQEYIDIFTRIIRNVISRSGLQDKDVAAIGISWAGAVKENGEIAAVSKIIRKVAQQKDEGPELDKIRHLGRYLTESEGVSIPVYVVNDGDALAFGFATYAEMRDTLCLGFGTSLAVGYIDEEGKLESEFGEGSKTIGDMSDHAAEHTGTGVKGVVQQYASQYGIVRVASDYPLFKQLLDSTDERDRARRVGEEVELFSRDGEKVLEKVADFIAVTIAQLHRQYRMENVILSGGVMNSESGTIILDKVREKIRADFPVINPLNIQTSVMIEKKVEGMSNKVNAMNISAGGKQGSQRKKDIIYSQFANAIGAAQFANKRYYDSNKKKEPAEAASEPGDGDKYFPLGRQVPPQALFSILEQRVNNERTEIVDAANSLLSVLRQGGIKIDGAPGSVNKKKATAEVKAKIESVISAVESLGIGKVSEDARKTAAHLKTRMDQLEADGVVASIIRLARLAKARKERPAKDEGEKLIIGLETDWIPGYNDIDNPQHQAMNPLITKIESISGILRSMGLNNVVLIHSSSKELASSIIKEADKNNTNLSNVVVLASMKTVESDEFASLRSTPTEKKAFIAAIDPSELERFFKENKDPTMYLDIKILEMLSIILDIAAGKEPPDIPMVRSDPSGLSLRFITLIPGAEIKNYEELHQKNFGRKTALAAA
jgi:predicted NBD/HSP70 family sugar kinase